MCGLRFRGTTATVEVMGEEAMAMATATEEAVRAMDVTVAVTVVVEEEAMALVMEMMASVMASLMAGSMEETTGRAPEMKAAVERVATAAARLLRMVKDAPTAGERFRLTCN